MSNGYYDASSVNSLRDVASLFLFMHSMYVCVPQVHHSSTAHPTSRILRLCSCFNTARDCWGTSVPSFIVCLVRPRSSPREVFTLTRSHPRVQWNWFIQHTHTLTIFSFILNWNQTVLRVLFSGNLSGCVVNYILLSIKCNAKPMSVWYFDLLWVVNSLSFD